MRDIHPDFHAIRPVPDTLDAAIVESAGAEIPAVASEISASTECARHSGRVERSPDSEAMGGAPQVGIGAIRSSVGRTTTAGEVDPVTASLHRVLH